MSATNLFGQLLVSKDGYIDQIDVGKAVPDNHGNIVAPGRVIVKGPDLDQINEAIRKSSLLRIRQHLEWTSRSVQARLGMDVESIHVDSKMQGDDMVLWANFSFKPWENPDGKPIENPLPPLVAAWLKRSRIACGRLFMRPLEYGPLSGKAISEARDQGKIDMNGAQIIDDGCVLPVLPNERYPLRFDLMDQERLHDAFTGSGRGAIDGIQPRINEDCILASTAYGIGSTRCSLLEHRGVLEPEMVNLRTGESSTDILHGSSRVWDAGKTTGMQYARHLEVQNRSSGPIKLDEHGVKLSIYPASNGNGVVSRVLRTSSSSIQREGLNFDHFLRSQETGEQEFRVVLEQLKEKDLAGMLVGAKGVVEIRKERHVVQQDQAVVMSAQKYVTEGGAVSSGAEDLCEFMAHMGDPRQRAILFAHEAPSSSAIKQLMDRGIRTIVTENVAQNDSKIYVSNSLLQHYRQLADEGLNLYLSTPTAIRKLWHYFFVDVRSLEKVRKADVRICVYCASVQGAERILEIGRYQEFLAAIQRDCPNVAIVTGAAKNGAMHYANQVARSMGIVTIGVANHINGQEATEDELDAGTFFDMDGFSARQELMARTGSCPMIGPGAQGSEFEGSLERTCAKIAKSPLPPIVYIDPVGLGRGGGHLWQPVMELEEQFTQSTQIPGGTPVQLTRSPFVAKLTSLHKTYTDAYEKQLRPYMRDPLKFWSERDVPLDMIQSAMARVMRDSEYTGLPVPTYLEPVLSKLNIRG